MSLEEKDGISPQTGKPVTYLIAKVTEGKCTYINDQMELRRWEESIAPLVLGKSRSYVIPHVLDPNSNGGRGMEFVTMGHKFTRTVQIDCSGNPTPTIRFKTILRNVSPAYSKFCNDHGFFERDLKRYDKKFQQLNVKLSMRLQTFVRGIKPKSRADKEDEKRELKSMLTLTLDRDEHSIEEPAHPIQPANSSDKLAEYIFFAKSANRGLSRFKTGSRRPSLSADISGTGGYMIGNKNSARVEEHDDAAGGRREERRG